MEQGQPIEWHGGRVVLGLWGIVQLSKEDGELKVPVGSGGEGGEMTDDKETANKERCKQPVVEFLVSSVS